MTRFWLSSARGCQGALTWWHLDDSGEHVFQVALPLAECPPGGAGRPVRERVVKVFVFAEVDDYDFIFQDDETNATGGPRGTLELLRTVMAIGNNHL